MSGPQLLTEIFWITPEALNEARGQKRIESISNGRYKVNKVRGQHCYLGEGKGLQRNRNGRRYPAETTWGRHTSEDADFMKRVRQRRVIGQLEHPQDGKSSMGLGAIVVTDVSPPDPNTGEVFISFESMSTPAGRIVGNYIDDGVGFGLSSRGSGSVVNKGGVDEVQPDFEPYTFDCVIDESTPGAEVASTKLREARSALVEAAQGNLQRAVELAQEQTDIALARCGPSGCSCDETMGGVDVATPTGHCEYLLAMSDGAGHYRAYDNGSALWDVWLHVHNLPPKRVATALQTLRDAKQAAESHLHNVVGESSGDGAQDDQADDKSGTAAGDSPAASADEAFTVSSSLPYMGTMLKMVFDSESEAKSAVGALEKAGFYSRLAADREVSVYTQIEDADQALEHVSRILADKGIEARNESVAIGAIHKGQVVWMDEEFNEEAASIRETGGMTREIAFDVEDFLGEMGPSAQGMPRMQGAGREHGVVGPHEMGRMSMPHETDIEMGDEGPEGYGDIEPEPSEDDDDYDDEEFIDLDADDDEYYEYYEQDEEPNGEEPEDDDDDDEDEPDRGENIGSPPVIDDPEDIDLDLEINDEEPEGNWSGSGYNESRGGKVFFRTIPWRAGGKPRGTVRLWFNESDDLVEVRGYDLKGRLLVRQRVGTQESKTQSEPKPEPKAGKRRISAKEAATRIVRGIIKEAGSYSNAGPSAPKAQVKRKGGKGSPDHGSTTKKGMAKSESKLISQNRFLQNEVARLESENDHLRELLEATAAVQQAEAIEAEVEKILTEHPRLKPLKNRLTRFETVDEVAKEAQNLLAILGESNDGDTPPSDAPPVEESEAPEAGSITEDQPAPEKPKAESIVRVVKRGSNGATSSGESTNTEGAPRGPVEDATPAAPLSESKKRDVGNTAGRVAAAMRRRRARRRDR